MFMIDIPINSAKLMRFSHMQGHPLEVDEDFGYAVHAWLAATLGDLAPKPFRLLECKDGLHLLGYTRYGSGELCDQARTYAEPVAAQVCSWDAIAAKPMPDSWNEGRRIGFEVRVCPVSRKERERDVFLAALEQAKSTGADPPSRERVYLDWLAQRMNAAICTGDNFIDAQGESHEPVVELIQGQTSIVGFRRIKVFRKDRRKGKASKRGIERPDVLFSGELVIRRSKEFGALLKRGIGRHRAFGFGMMLLRPPGR